MILYQPRRNFDLYLEEMYKRTLGEVSYYFLSIDLFTERQLLLLERIDADIDDFLNKIHSGELCITQSFPLPPRSEWKYPEGKEKIAILLRSGPTLSETPAAVAVANDYLNKINFVEFINSNVVWDEKRWNVSPGALAKSVVLSTFYEVRQPVYKIEELFKKADTEFLFGCGVISANLKDDAIATCFDRIYVADPDNTFTNLSLSVYSQFNLDMGILHGDTSNRVMYGDYEMCNLEDYTGLKIVKGHSKAHRPDKNQVGIGQIVNKEGIPFISQTLDGNKADCEWNAEAITTLRSVLSPDVLAEVIYVADCKLVTMPNIHLLCKTKDENGNDVVPVKFVSLIPDNFFNKISERMVEQAYCDNNWSEPVSLNANKLTQYRTQSYTRRLEGHELRFIVVESTSKQGCIDKMIEKAKTAFEKDVDKLLEMSFDSEKDALKALKDFQFHHKKKLFTLEAAVESKTVVKFKRGRRAKDQAPKVDNEKTTWHIAAGKIEPHQENTTKAIREEMTFVLVTNVTEKRLADQEVLFTYKGQSVCEIKFHLIKQPCFIPAIFTKTPERIKALVMLLNVSLLIRGLMQYAARENMKFLSEAPKIGVGGRKFDRPTSENMIYLLRNYSIRFDGQNHYIDGINNAFDDERFTTLLMLLDVDESALFPSSA